MFKKINCFLILLILSVAYVQAATIEQALSKALEKEYVSALLLKRPDLSPEQLKQIPSLLTKATKQAHVQLDLLEMNKAEVLLNIYDYLNGYNLLEELAVTEQEVMAAREVPAEIRTYALQMALMIVLPKRYARLFEPDSYPEVTNQIAFYQYSQAYMDEFYRILSLLAQGDQEYLEQVFVIDPD